MSKFKHVIAFSIVGYVCVLGIKYAERILISLAKILGMLASVSPKTLIVMEIIPELLIASLWAVILFKYLKNFNWNESFNAEICKKAGIRLGITVLVLFIVMMVLTYFENELWLSKRGDYFFETEFVKNKIYIISAINFVEIVIIVFGFIKLINKKA